MKNYEVISVFGKNAEGVNYYPQGLKKMEETKRKGSENSSTETLGHIQRRKDYQQEFTNYPQAIISFPCDADRFHPTQKPVNLMRYLIMTYSLMGGGNFGQLHGKRNNCNSLH